MANELGTVVSDLANQQYVLRAAPRSFKPWHKPRKQYVRRRHIDDILGPLLADGEGPVRYLGLPGADLLDIRWMRNGVCQHHCRDLLFVGFDTDRVDEACRSSIEASKLKMEAGIDGRSGIIETAFQSLADEDSHAFEIARKLGTFDIVNIDLCNGLAGETPTASGLTVYNAIATLLGLQVKRQQPWMLMITTRVDRRNVDLEASRKLSDILSDNLKHCQGFSVEFEKNFGASNLTKRTLSMMNANVLAQLRTIAISKWIIGLAAGKQMRAELASAISYTVYSRNGHPDLLSLAFRIDPVDTSPPFDRFRISDLPAKMEMDDECARGLFAMELVRDAQDADEVLRQDTSLLMRAIQESVDLLVAAGYDADEYRLWLDGNQGAGDG